jgi:hypothetical protein
LRGNVQIICVHSFHVRPCGQSVRAGWDRNAGENFWRRVASVKLAVPEELTFVGGPLGNNSKVIYRQPAVAAGADMFGHPCSIEFLGTGSRTGLRALVSGEIRQQFQLQFVWPKLTRLPPNPSVLGDAEQASSLLLRNSEVPSFAVPSRCLYTPPPGIALLARQSHDLLLPPAGLCSRNAGVPRVFGLSVHVDGDFTR